MLTAVQRSMVHVNGVDLAYVEQGRGDPVVFIHGSLGDYRNWDGQLPAFGKRYRTIAYSRRHHWPNAQPGEGAGYDIAQHVADLGAFIEALRQAASHVMNVQDPPAYNSAVLDFLARH